MLDRVLSMGKDEANGLYGKSFISVGVSCPRPVVGVRGYMSRSLTSLLVSFCIGFGLLNVVVVQACTCGIEILGETDWGT